MYDSLVTLAVQNSALTIIMVYSRVSMPASRAYSAATAVLMNELLKGTISLIIAFCRIDSTPSGYEPLQPQYTSQRSFGSLSTRLRKLWSEVFAQDCWKLSIPAILYGEFYSTARYIWFSNPVYSHSEQSAIRGSIQPRCSHLPGYLPNENSDNCRVFRAAVKKKAITKSMAIIAAARPGSWNRADSVCIKQAFCWVVCPHRHS